MSENEIISLCQKQERTAQKELFGKYYGKMMGLCLRYAKSRTEANDMVEKGFLAVFLNIAAYQQQSSFDEWMKAVFIKNNIQLLKSNRQQYYIASTVNSVNDQLREADAQLSRTQPKEASHLQAQDYVRIIQQMPPSLRSVFNMFVIDGYSHQQISDILEISEETSKRNLEQARFALQKGIQNLGF